MKGKVPLETVGKLLTFIAGTNNGIKVEELLNYLREKGSDKSISLNSFFGPNLPPSRILGLLCNFENEVVKSKCSKQYKFLVEIAKSRSTSTPNREGRNTMISGHKDHKTVMQQKHLPKDFIRGGRTQ